MLHEVVDDPALHLTGRVPNEQKRNWYDAVETVREMEAAGVPHHSGQINPWSARGTKAVDLIHVTRRRPAGSEAANVDQTRYFPSLVEAPLKVYAHCASYSSDSHLR